MKKLAETQKLFSRILRKLKPHGVIDIYLFGSIRHLAATDKSDIDIFVIVKPEANKYWINKQIALISKEYNKNALVSPIILTKEELEFRKILPKYKITIEDSIRIK